ncbi:uncharacterized protein PHACADRAFT_248868 [Phanerochaete carnosa HHB-10118-sp]|uniref:Uncharacterized protein n=1 Tax=Phanerochaete carnosa (strain HHB-10118-sp) TaxID=650164 RepID=K5W4D9_PHACS|nr:uncharacterized protein PHACADRAFT_248868 [Phanerochaete carnosa HHB-10118-sp]EKM58778.1 hypothetical protein PHACADRAFT_248868 [Phanerochaete carnosa HHB-10118-sp]
MDDTAYSPNGALVARIDFDGSVKIWDAATGACLKSFNANHSIHQLTFSPDSSRLCVRAYNSCFIYDVQSCRRIAVLQDEKSDKIEFSMSRQGDRIVTGTNFGASVKVWNAVTGQELLTIRDKRKPTPPVAFSPDGAEVLAVRKTDRTALAYDSRTGRLRHIFRLSHPPHCLTYSPNGDYVAFADLQGSLEVYGAKSRTFIGRIEGFGNGARLQEAEFLPDSQTILSHITWTRHEPLRLCNIHDLVRMR